MAGTKEIRLKIKSVQSTRKITKAMEMVAASKMKKAQERMRAGRPYAQRILAIAMHAARANTEYRHPLLTRRAQVKRVGVVVITTDKGLCGGLNTNLLRLVLSSHKEWTARGHRGRVLHDRQQGLQFRQPHGWQDHLAGRQLWRPSGARAPDRPGEDADRRLPRRAPRRSAHLLEPLHQHHEAGADARHDDPHPAGMAGCGRQPGPRRTRRPEQLGLPVRARSADRARPAAGALPRDVRLPGRGRQHRVRAVGAHGRHEGRLGQRAARIIDELQLIYNKSRQAAITKELSEIVGGAAAV